MTVKVLELIMLTVKSRKGFGLEVNKRDGICSVYELYFTKLLSQLLWAGYTNPFSPFSY